MVMISGFFRFYFMQEIRAVARISNVQQFMEIFNKDALGDSSAAKSSRSCIKRGSAGQWKSQAVEQLKPNQPSSSAARTSKVILRLYSFDIFFSEHKLYII
jgi:hypothetical protein